MIQEEIQFILLMNYCYKYEQAYGIWLLNFVINLEVLLAISNKLFDVKLTDYSAYNSKQDTKVSCNLFRSYLPFISYLTYMNYLYAHSFLHMTNYQVQWNFRLTSLYLLVLLQMKKQVNAKVSYLSFFFGEVSILFTPF